MVLTDTQLDELWRALGSYRGKINEHLEVAMDTEKTLFSMVIERLFREYRELLADYEHDHTELERLMSDYKKRIAELSEMKKKYDDLNNKYQTLMRRTF